MRLADLQKSLAAGLLSAHHPAPAGLSEAAVARSRRALIAKRRQAVAHLLPRLRAALGATWNDRFVRHAESYAPSGLLHHVDDAWELAETVLRGPDRTLAAAARDDLVHLRLRYARDRKAGAHRIHERRAPLVALVRTPVRHLIVRLPGVEGRIWSMRI